MGGFPGWVAAGGETEPITEATNATPQPNTQPSNVPTNPTTNDSKTPSTVAPKKDDGAKAQPAGTTTQAPTKTTAKSKKSKHRRTKPSSD